MAIETICSGCGQKLAVADEHAGKRARCPSCGQIYSVPHSASGPDYEEQPDQEQKVRGQPFTEPQDTSDSKAANAALAETIAGPEGEAAPQHSPQPIPQLEQFWMQTGDGSLYGPVDRANLNRWFHEGRVGPGYQLRVGEAGTWQPAELFKPRSQTATYAAGLPHPGNTYPGESKDAGTNFVGANPYADNAYRPAYSTSIGRFQKGDPSGLVLTMGILSWVCLLMCPLIHWIPGLVAWITGSSALKDIQAGIADPSNRALVQVGYYLGMINVIITLLGLAGFFAFALLAGIAQNF